MFGWELRKPSIVGLMASISILIVLVTYTFIVYSLDDLMEIIFSLVLDVAVFVTILLVVCRDVQWLEIFSVPKFQKQIGIITIVIAVMFAIGMVAVSQDKFSQINAAIILIFLVGIFSQLIYSCAISAKKDLKL